MLTKNHFKLLKKANKENEVINLLNHKFFSSSSNVAERVLVVGRAVVQLNNSSSIFRIDR